jgi:hypothetical protein
MNESLGYDARALIDQASGGDDPSQADRERMRARLAMVATTGGFAVAGAAKAATGAATSAVSGAGAATGAAATVAGAGGVVAATGVAALGTKIAVAVALVSALGGGGALVVSSAHRNAARAVPPVSTSAAAASVVNAGPVAMAPVAAPVVEAPLASPPSMELPASEGAVPLHPAIATPGPSAAPAAERAAAPDVADELVLLRGARSALKAGNAERSLQLLGEHARRFPHGALTEEREAARAVATCAMVTGSAGGGGSADTARATVARFFRAYPRSLHARRVHNACDDLDAPVAP